MSEANKEAVALTEAPTTLSPVPTMKKDCVHLDMGHMVKRHAKPNACYSREEMQDMIRNLVYNFAAMMEEHDLDYWLCSGTLLGSFRSQGLIPYDVDADVGVTSESLDALRHLPVKIPDEYELQVLHSKIHYDGGDANIPARFIDRRSGFYIDVFEFLATQKVTAAESTKKIDVVVDPSNPSIVYKDDAELTLQANKTMTIRMEITTIEETKVDYLGPIKSVCWAGCARCPEPQHFIVPRDWIYPRQRCQFDDREVWCPANPKDYLRMLYGDNYMRPDHLRRLTKLH
ncbi:hypothetical protein THRCLA_06862 [Thraustotheca clavata]|uniref:LicD/FKTN/FKRP nucleotidyltransferase domain-containing protein n=1 Tax=Thraustotheca clavata TaxID=74557 RepID=A0A1V9ZIG8_9STRA|nr:hypothetical protein THRCLA_06862 [Thraustotheca clavata]